jgi:hypothetical protein
MSVSRRVRAAEGDAATLARIVSAVMFLSMAASVNIAVVLRGFAEQTTLIAAN